MSARKTLDLDTLSVRRMFVRNYFDNAPVSTQYIQYADGSGGTYWSSLYITNIPGFSSFYASTIGATSTLTYELNYQLSTYYESTIEALESGLSSLSTIFNCEYMPSGVYSTIAGLGTLGYVSTPTLNVALQSTVNGLGANTSSVTFSSVSTVQRGPLRFDVQPTFFEWTSSTRNLMRLSSNGYLGIGQNAPITNLDISGSVLFRSPNGVYIGPDGSLVVNRPFNTPPSATLDVSGSIVASNVYFGSGIFAGSVTAASYLTSSDSNLKTNINTYEPQPKAWDTLRGVTFDWKKSGEHDIGFIAQELKQAVPESVRFTESGELHIEPTKILPLLVETIKEMRAEIASLKARVSALE